MTDSGDLHGMVLAALRGHYVRLPREEMDALAREIVSAVVGHLHETGAPSVPPEDITHFPMTDPHNETP